MFTKIVNHHSDMFFTFFQLTFMKGKKKKNQVLVSLHTAFCFTIIQFESLTFGSSTGWQLETLCLAQGDNSRCQRVRCEFEHL